MSQNTPLRIASIEGKPNRSQRANPQSRKLEIQAQMERLWLKNPQQLDPQRDCIERHRIDITIKAIEAATKLSGKSAVDLGCGSGALSRLLRDAGAHVDAVDVAGNALALLKAGNMENITALQDCLPNTALKDSAYDLVVCTEVIAYLRLDDYRLLMAELSRLVKSDGIVVCSTPLDINTDNPLDRFAGLAETEFSVDEWIVNYHLLLIKLLCFFEAPGKFVRASGDRELRDSEIKARRGIGRCWFSINSSIILALVWRVFGVVFNPIAKFLRQSKKTMKILESISRFFWSDAGISHALFIGKRRPLTFDVKADAVPRELKHKRQVWE